MAAYVGLDIVPSVVAFNERRFCHHVNKLFAHWDFVACGIPQLKQPGQQLAPFGMIHMKHALQHLSCARARVSACLTAAATATGALN